MSRFSALSSIIRTLAILSSPGLSGDAGGLPKVSALWGQFELLEEMAEIGAVERL
jgi:hypothetical protein